MNTFLKNNKVLVTALLSALLIVLQQAFLHADMNFIAILFAAFVALLGVVANQWKGQGFTITGIIGTIANAFVDTQTGGHFTWRMFTLSALVAIIAALISAMNANKKEA
jgi:hypothetical protein